MEGFTSKTCAMEWDVNEDNDIRIAYKTDWIKLEEYNEVDRRAGVYIFADDKFDVKYIGKAMERPSPLEHISVFEIYSAMLKGKANGALLVKALYTSSNEQARELDDEMVRKYSPANNIYLTER